MGAPWNSGRKPSVLASNGSMGLRSTGTSTNSPQRPKTTLGMPASSPIGNEPTDFTEDGAISVRKSASPTETGSASTSATALVTSVPKMYGSAPDTARGTSPTEVATTTTTPA